ncbi:hypothetical protein QZH46_17200 [Pseudomonas corrugata]|nr:hypothetical protein AXG94_20855 [Pseudomonas corrugata]
MPLTQDIGGAFFVGAGLWEQGLPAMNDNAAHPMHRGAAIAGKPCSHSGSRRTIEAVETP